MRPRAALLLSVLLPLAGTEPVERAEVTSTQVAGQLFGTWVWPFELLSLLLLAALVGGARRLAGGPRDRHGGAGRDGSRRMIHLAGPYLLAALLVGLGVAGITVRRNAVLLLVGVELVLSGGLVLLVATQAAGGDRWASGSVLPLFVITIAAAEVVVALAVVLAAFRSRGTIDLDERSGEAP